VPDDPELVVLATLASLETLSEILPCDPELADTAAFCAHYGYRLDESANTIVVAGRVDPPPIAVCVALADSRLDVNHVVRHRLGVRRASFASADLTRELTGMAIGGVTPFGLPHGLPLWVDARVMDQPRVILGGGSRSIKVMAEPRILLELPNVEVVEGLATPPADPTRERATESA
jgi:prolyl-tRNA editing enzyme YbaK/EbsC (Cys-tRNA(Pro) deacylase)